MKRTILILGLLYGLAASQTGGCVSTVGVKCYKTDETGLT